MVKKITISLPDELFEKMQDIKEGTNISKVCQEAIMEQVERGELTGSEELVDFLKGSKKAFEAECKSAGAKLATAMIKEKRIDYPLFKALTEDPGPVDLWDFVKNACEETSNYPAWDSWIGPELDGNTGSDLFLEGFVDKVCEVWCDLEAKLD